MSTTLRSKENYCMGRMGPRLCIQTTTACNGKCFFCVGRFNKPSKTDVDKIIENAISLDKYPDVLLLGGESTLFPDDLVKIIDAIAPYKRKITVNTNGYNLRCLLPVATKLDKLIVSVMGDKETNDNIVGVVPELDLIEKFHALNPKLKLRVNCVVNKKGICSFDKMEEFAIRMKELGFTSVKFSEMSTDDPNDPNFVDLQELLKPYCDDVHQNDTLQYGCYLEPDSLKERFGVKTILNLTCNLKTPIKQPEFEFLKYEPVCFDSIYISPDGSIHKRIVATQDLANDRGAC
ncbi:MAG: radical SAM protein [Ruminococcus sp.]|nr:radical SAM protein [Ruminococcus sp.]